MKWIATTTVGWPPSSLTRINAATRTPSLTCAFCHCLPRHELVQEDKQAEAKAEDKDAESKDDEAPVRVSDCCC